VKALPWQFYSCMFWRVADLHKQEMAETFKQSRQALIFEKDMPPVYENFEKYYQETFKKD